MKIAVLLISLAVAFATNVVDNHNYSIKSVHENQPNKYDYTQYVIKEFTKNSLCIQHLNVTGPVSNNCNYGLGGCSDCGEFCTDHGYPWLCCYGNYCCCFKSSGPCNRAGSACPSNFCF